MTGPSTRPKPALFRSVLFAPANHERRTAKVFASGADVAVLDLEDAVAASDKVAARAQAVAALSLPRNCGGYIRVNALDSTWCYGDLVALVGPWLDGVMVPKVESGQAIATIDWLLTQLERDRGLDVGSIDLLPLVETARGVEALAEIAAASGRVRRLSFGGGDYTLDLGLTWTRDEEELGYARARMTHASRAAGLEAPIDTVLIEFADSARFSEASARGRGLGFQGKLCIHPAQVPLANAAFAPTAAEVTRARAIVAAFDAAEAAGVAAIRVGDEFVDYPVAERARRIVALAAQLAEPTN